MGSPECHWHPHARGLSGRRLGSRQKWHGFRACGATCRIAASADGALGFGRKFFAQLGRCTKPGYDPPMARLIAGPGRLAVGGSAEIWYWKRGDGADTGLLGICIGQHHTGTLYQKRFVQPADVRTANAIQLLAAFVVTLPLIFLEHEPIVWNGYFLSAMAWSVLGLTLGGSSLLYLLIQRGAATAVTSLLYLVPPTTALMAWALFGESITLVTIAGTALTALGVSLVVRPAKRAGA